MYRTHTITTTQWNDAQKTLLLPIDESLIAEKMQAFSAAASERGLAPKQGFSIIVLGYAAGQAITNVLGKCTDEERAAHEQAIAEIIESTSWIMSLEAQATWYIEKNYRDLIAKKVREKRQSIIQMVFMPQAGACINRINAALGTDIEVPPPHITLYTTSTDPEHADHGIGLNSKKALESLHPEKLE